MHIILFILLLSSCAEVIPPVDYVKSLEDIRDLCRSACEKRFEEFNGAIAIDGPRIDCACANQSLEAQPF